MSERDPIRLLERGDVPELSETLRAASQRLPDAAAMARIAARLGSAASAAPVAATSKLWLVAAKVAAGASVVAGGFFAAQGLSPRETLPPAVVVTVPSVAPAPPPSISVAPPPAVSAAAPFEPAASAAPERSARAPEPSSELELVARAESALRSNPAQALRLVEEHARRFPRASLSEEREVIAVEALARLGQGERAVKRAETFNADHPGSAYRARIERAIERYKKASE
jgi:hypothetical protein